jgi:hypothetical protein
MAVMIIVPIFITFLLSMWAIRKIDQLAYPPYGLGILGLSLDQAIIAGFAAVVICLSWIVYWILEAFLWVIS